MHKIVSS